MDRRAYPRFPMELPVTFEADAWTAEGKSRNLSAGGCHVQSTATLAVGTYLRVKLYHTHNDVMDIDLAAVRWVRGSEFGLEFLYMHPEEYDRLLTFAPPFHPEPTCEG